ncbi:MAG: Crp/Fnr family transcriptional regulator [Pseudomonadales bacterium]
MKAATDKDRPQVIKTVRAVLNVPESISLDSMIEGPFTLPRSKYLFFEGEAATDLFIVLNGTMKAIRSMSDGDEIVVRFHYPNEAIWTDVFHDARRTTTVSALEPSTFCSVPYKELDRLISVSEQVQRCCYNSLSRVIKQDRNFISMLARSNACERVCCYLLSLYNRQVSKGAHVYLPMSRTEMASHLGLATETVSRVLSKLQDEKVIDADRQWLDVLDIPHLYSLAGMTQPVVRLAEVA